MVSEKGYGKRSDIDGYRVTHRGGKGVKTIKGYSNRYSKKFNLNIQNFIGINYFDSKRQKQWF